MSAESENTKKMLKVFFVAKTNNLQIHFEVNHQIQISLPESRLSVFHSEKYRRQIMKTWCK